jgi:hypothetical protein
MRHRNDALCVWLVFVERRVCDASPRDNADIVRSLPGLPGDPNLGPNVLPALGERLLGRHDSWPLPFGASPSAERASESEQGWR